MEQEEITIVLGNVRLRSHAEARGPSIVGPRGRIGIHMRKLLKHSTADPTVGAGSRPGVNCIQVKNHKKSTGSSSIGFSRRETDFFEVHFTWFAKNEKSVLRTTQTHRKVGHTHAFDCLRRAPLSRVSRKVCCCCRQRERIRCVLDSRLLMFILLHDDRMSTRCSAGAATAALRGQRSPHVAAMSGHAEAAPTSLLWLAVAGCARSFHMHQPSSCCYGCFICFKCFGGVAMTARRLRLVDVAMPQPSLQMSECCLTGGSRGGSYTVPTGMLAVGSCCGLCCAVEGPMRGDA